MFSAHAKVRMQQRGFKVSDVNAIIDYGIETISHGASVFLCTKKQAAYMRKIGVSPKTVEKCKGAYVVVFNGNVKTVAHKYKH